MPPNTRRRPVIIDYGSGFIDYYADAELQALGITPLLSMSESESEEEEEEEDDEEEEDGGYIPVDDSTRVSLSHDSRQFGNGCEESLDKRRRVEGGTDVSNFNGSEVGECSSQEWNRSEIDGLFCPICMEAWTSEGVHHICCLPCGHLYGLSCIKKWLQQQQFSKKCPQCNRKCKLTDIRKIYARRIAVVDEESQKRIHFLEAKCASLEKKGADLLKKEAEWAKKEAEWEREVNQLKVKAYHMEHLLADEQRSKFEVTATSGGWQGQFLTGGSMLRRQEHSSAFLTQRELRVDGARLLDMDILGQIILIARKLPGVGGKYVLTKMSLLTPYESEDILLPSCTKTIKDLRISPSKSGLALYASLGKRLSVISTESNSVVLSYDLPAAAWSCSWDLNSPHHVYAGLQNGFLLVFDMRQTAKPLESRSGLSSNPIHTVYSLLHNSRTCENGDRTVLSASSIGLCHWNFDCSDHSPILVPGLNDQEVCISLAYCSSTSDIVASYRPKVESFNEISVSQAPLSSGQGVKGSHVHLKKTGQSSYLKLGSTNANVNSIRLPKSTVIGMKTGKNSLLASEDDSNGELVLQELPSFTIVNRFQSHKHVVHDIKYAQMNNRGLLGCTTEDAVQLFNVEL